MVWELIFAAALGFAVGMRLRVAGLLVVTMLIVIANAVAGFGGFHPAAAVLWSVFVQVTVLQVSYVVGLFVSTRKRREKTASARSGAMLMKSRRS